MSFQRVLSVALVSLLAALVVGQERPTFQPEPASTDRCLRCICEAASGCNLRLRCDGDVCGPYRITFPYWQDANKPTVPGNNADDHSAYVTCANNVFCATQAVRNYLTRYAQDCNGDGEITCHDLAAIHNRGPGGCTGPLAPDFQDRFQQCEKRTSPST